jgi:hypothetical protein
MRQYLGLLPGFISSVRPSAIAVRADSIGMRHCLLAADYAIPEVDREANPTKNIDLPMAA